LLLAGVLVSCGGGGGGGGDGSGGDGSGSVDNTPPPTGTRFEESNAAVSFSGVWTQSDPNFGWSGGAARQSEVVGAQAAFTFTGTSVRWIGNRNVRSGIALVRVDAGPAIEVDLFARSEEIHTPIITLNGLSPGRHTLTIEVTGRRNPAPEAESSVVVVDAFEVQVQPVSHLQETDPDVAFSADDWVQDGNFAWSGGGVFTAPEPVRGGARVTETPGAKATLTFRGTAISWSGARSPNGGIASVSVDGGVASEVDTYSPTNKIQGVVFTATGLADESHTLTIEATGRGNDASMGAQIVVDAFDVTTPGRRYQEKDAALAYSSGVGDWIFGNPNRTWSEGYISQSNKLGAKVTFTFTGTSVSWIGLRKLSTGLANVYLDGVVSEINTYLDPPMEAYQTTIFRADGLANGTHTLTIEVASSGSYIVVDAFDVRP
jgi:hypothetical protein